MNELQERAIRAIESCQTIEQLDAMQEYIKLIDKQVDGNYEVMEPIRSKLAEKLFEMNHF